MVDLGVINYYCQDSMRALKNIVFPMFSKFGLPMSEYDDFLSIANLTLWQCSQSFDESLNDNFDLFLRGCLQNKFKTELTRRNRQRRVPDNMIVCLDSVIQEEDSRTRLDSLVVYNVPFDEMLGSKEQYYDKVSRYESRLSELQKSMLSLLVDGYTHTEIKERLHISAKVFSDNLENMRTFENIKILLSK